MSVGFLWIGLLLLMALTGGTHWALLRAYKNNITQTSVIFVSAYLVYIAFGLAMLLIGEVAPYVSILPIEFVLKCLGIVLCAIGSIQIGLFYYRQLIT
jgi:hypothetical protein